MDGKRRIVTTLAVVVAVAAFANLLRVMLPGLGAEMWEATWAPRGLAGLATARGFLALGLALVALLLLAFTFRPTRRQTPATFFSDDERRTIREAIAAAESVTSGEIRVHLARRTPGDVRAAAEATFAAIGMTATAARNGVLIYLSVADHRFAIIGDESIDHVVPPGFWDEIKMEMQQHFARDRFAEGICAAVRGIGEKLREHFPIQEGDVNELPNQISLE